ncbi:hypothetical protein GYMLUDRAFT_219034 [Collybiopsis luxurians FD-317 M1]|nr:hypothetical protein GYMLUDRAFT_219034 [Collybiopsis luxurians FD-317 M1]
MTGPLATGSRPKAAAVAIPTTRTLRSSSTRSSSNVRLGASHSSGLKARESVHTAAVTLYELDESKNVPNVSDDQEAHKSRIERNVEKSKRSEVVSEDEESEEADSRPAKRVKIETDEEQASEFDDLVAQKQLPHFKTKSPRKRKVPDHPHFAPSNWRQAYDLIHEMRYTLDGVATSAPVDTMGCDIAGEGEGLEGEDKNKRFSILISLMLSSQTKDHVTHAAITNLRTSLGGSLSASSLASAPHSLVEESINKVGFWRRKTEYIQAAAIRCRDSYDGDVPKTIEELLEFKGVGKKMGYLLLQSGWGLNLGIGVDVHVHRITNRLGWHKPPTKTPEETRINLESWLPHELHPKINHMLVGFGQMICTPVRPKCNECSLSTIKGLCPSVQLSQSSPRKGKAVITKAKTKTVSGELIVTEEQEVKVETAEREDDAFKGGGPSLKIELEEEEQILHKN